MTSKSMTKLFSFIAVIAVVYLLRGIVPGQKYEMRSFAVGSCTGIAMILIFDPRNNK